MGCVESYVSRARVVSSASFTAKADAYKAREARKLRSGVKNSKGELVPPIIKVSKRPLNVPKKKVRFLLPAEQAQRKRKEREAKLLKRLEEQRRQAKLDKILTAKEANGGSGRGGADPSAFSSPRGSLRHSSSRLGRSSNSPNLGQMLGKGRSSRRDDPSSGSETDGSRGRPRRKPPSSRRSPVILQQTVSSGGRTSSPGRTASPGRAARTSDPGGGSARRAMKKASSMDQDLSGSWDRGSTGSGSTLDLRKSRSKRGNRGKRQAKSNKALRTSPLDNPRGPKSHRGLSPIS